MLTFRHPPWLRMPSTLAASCSCAPPHPRRLCPPASCLASTALLTTPPPPLLSTGYSASTIPTDNKDLTFSGDLHDLAALRLGQPVPEPVTVSLPDASLVVPSGAGLQVAGWGVTENGQPSSILK
jgi:hypothetical protein